jgi:hypothetical protein
MKILIEFPQGWEPKKIGEDCPETCPFESDCIIQHGDFDPKPCKCMFVEYLDNPDNNGNWIIEK